MIASIQPLGTAPPSLFVGEAAADRTAHALRLDGGWPGPARQSSPRGARAEAHAARGKMPVLQADEARTLLDAIDTASLPNLRDRALISA
jgi:kynureninase